MKFHEVTIEELEYASKDLVVITLSLTQEQQEQLDYSPGQHTTIRMVSNGKEIRRSYSYASSPFENAPPRLLIKLIEGGAMSNYIRNLNVGDSIEISDTQGFFYADINTERSPNYFLVAQDIGIAPIYSILKSVLVAESISQIILFYVVSNRDHYIFDAEIKLLEREYKNRLRVVTLLKKTGIIPKISSWISSRENPYGQAIEETLEQAPFPLDTLDVFISGQSIFADYIRFALNEKNIDARQIHMQAMFVKSAETMSTQKVENCKIIIKGASNTTLCDFQTPILSALQDNLIDPPYACEQGLCGTCAAKLIKGEVASAESRALDSRDIDDGYILTCQSYPRSEQIELDFKHT